MPAGVSISISEHHLPESDSGDRAGSSEDVHEDLAVNILSGKKKKKIVQDRGSLIRLCFMSPPATCNAICYDTYIVLMLQYSLPQAALVHGVMRDSSVYTNNHLAAHPDNAFSSYADFICCKSDNMR
ncbi:hypothetical protein ACLOJK_010379 [Asimina triloba]